MKKTLLILIFSFIAISVFCQDYRIYNKAVVVKSDSVIINQYFDTVRIETLQDINIYELNEYPDTLLHTLCDDCIVNKGEIYTYNNERLVIVQNHNRATVNHYNPHDLPALYLFREAGCAEWVQPTGVHDAYNIGDCVTFNGLEYESLINANIWSPTVYPAGWQQK